MLAGLSTDAELADRFHVSVATFKKWRRENPRFDAAVANALANAVTDVTAIAVGNIKKAIQEGDLASSWRWAERTTDYLTPTQRTEHSLDRESLQEALDKRRMSIEEMEKQGILIDVSEGSKAAS